MAFLSGLAFGETTQLVACATLSFIHKIAVDDEVFDSVIASDIHTNSPPTLPPPRSQTTNTPFINLDLGDSSFDLYSYLRVLSPVLPTHPSSSSWISDLRFLPPVLPPHPSSSNWNADSSFVPPVLPTHPSSSNWNSDISFVPPVLPPHQLSSNWNADSCFVPPVLPTQPSSSNWNSDISLFPPVMPPHPSSLNLNAKSSFVPPVLPTHPLSSNWNADSSIVPPVLPSHSSVFLPTHPLSSNWNADSSIVPPVLSSHSSVLTLNTDPSFFPPPVLPTHPLAAIKTDLQNSLVDLPPVVFHSTDISRHNFYTDTCANILHQQHPTMSSDDVSFPHPLPQTTQTLLISYIPPPLSQISYLSPLYASTSPQWSSTSPQCSSTSPKTQYSTLSPQDTIVFSSFALSPAINHTLVGPSLDDTNINRAFSNARATEPHSVTNTVSPFVAESCALTKTRSGVLLDGYTTQHLYVPHSVTNTVVSSSFVAANGAVTKTRGDVLLDTYATRHLCYAGFLRTAPALTCVSPLELYSSPLVDLDISIDKLPLFTFTEVCGNTLHKCNPVHFMYGILNNDQWNADFYNIERQ